MTDNMQRAREPKFGDWIRGIYASERNPIRDGIYVRTTRRNHETLYELTDGKGKFWMYPKQSTELLDRPNAFDTAALRLAVPEFPEPGVELPWPELPRCWMGSPVTVECDDGERVTRAVYTDDQMRIYARECWTAMLAAAPTVSAEGESDAHG